MKLGIDWSQASTKRGAIWAAGAVVMGICLLTGHPDYIGYVITGVSGIAGGVGLAVKD